MPEELAPPVVAVVVTSNPEGWLEECLESLTAQDYPNLALLVVDDGSSTDLTGRVAAVAPTAILRRRGCAGGYAAAADEALRGVSGASFLLFCHDDVVLERDAARRLVEESFRSNAGVVGPKLVEAADPERLLQVGLGMHRLGTPAPRVQPGELDQSQHDGARDVFALPGACLLVRADLFEALGGFDPAMSLFGEDVDFCWRAQVAGARVTVAPQARVRHRQLAATGGRPVGDATLLRRRHELRAALKDYSAWRLLPVLLELVLLGAAEMAVGFLSGDRERSRRVVRAWRWNLSERASLAEERRRLNQLRQVSDRELRRRMGAPGRLQRFMRPDGEARTPERLRSAVSGIEHEVDRLGTWWTRLQRGEVPAAQVSVAVVLVVLFLFGTRDMLFSRLPLVGGLLPLPPGTVLLGRFFAGVSAGGTAQPAPTGYGLVGLLGLVLANSSALAVKLVVFGAIGFGAVGCSRLVRPFASSRGRLVAAGAFLALPLVWNVLATGDVQAAVALGALPYLFGRIARATGLEPFVLAPPAGSRSLLGEMAPFGLLLAVAVSLSPPTLLAASVVLGAVLLACLLAGRPQAAGRALSVFLGAFVIAALCCLPWSLSWLESGARWSAFSGAVPGAAVSAASLLRGHVGPVGQWWGAFGLAAAAGYATLVARGERLRWATAWWLAAAGAVALGWAGGRGLLGAGGGATAVLAAPAGIAVAAACGLGMAAFERDVLSAKGLGWRQATAGLAAIFLLVGAFPALGDLVGGRAGLPSLGVEQVLDWTATGRTPYRVLWLGDPRALPGGGWQLSRGLAWYTSTRGLPGSEQEWPIASPGGTAAVGQALRRALDGSTAQVGSLLGPLGIRYVVVPTGDAPAINGTQTPPVLAPPPAGLVSVLGSQSDLVERPVEAGAYVYANADWSKKDGAGRPPVAPFPQLRVGFKLTDTWRELGLALGLVAWLGAVAEGVRRRRSWGGGAEDASGGESGPEEGDEEAAGRPLTVTSSGTTLLADSAGARP